MKKKRVESWDRWQLRSWSFQKSGSDGEHCHRKNEMISPQKFKTGEGKLAVQGKHWERGTEDRTLSTLERSSERKKNGLRCWGIS